MPELGRCPQGHLLSSAEKVCPQCGSQAVEETQLSYSPLPPPSQPVLPAIEGYEILAEVGRGGMGRVYKARDVRLNRVVALKLLLAGEFADDGVVARFRAEAEALAQLQSPHIVQIFEVGAYLGKPFLALEFVAGQHLGQKMADQPQPPRQAAAWVECLASAIHSAHQRGIIHRDMKPANILVASDGVLKITDFGLAKRLSGATWQKEETTSGGKNALTASGAILGTPSYMAPEQAGVSGATIGPATDVWALGAILYEALTGRPPFQGLGLLATLEQVKEQEPVPPTALQPRLPRDLATICLKCLEKAPSRRYASAAALADDLQRFLAGEPIQARPVGWWGRSGKWVHRNPAVAVLLTAVLLSLLAGTLISALFAWDAYEQAGAARKAEKRADHEAGAARLQKSRADDQAGKNLQLAVLAQMERRLADQRLYVANLRLIQRAWQENQLAWQTELLQAVQPQQTDGIDLRGFEWFYWRRLNQPAVVLPSEAALNSLAFGPTGEVLAYTSGNTIKFWDFARASNVRELSTAKGNHGHRPVAYSPDGKYLATGLFALLNIWDVQGNPLFTLKGHTHAIRSLAFSPNSDKLASAAQDGTVRVWDLHQRKTLRVLGGHTGAVVGVAFSADGALLASTSYDGTLKLWDARTGKDEWTISDRAGAGQAVAFSPTESLLASSGEKQIELWDPLTRRHLRSLAGHTGIVASVAFSPDGRCLASCSWDKTVRIWDVKSSTEIAHFLSRLDRPDQVEFSPDGKWLAIPGMVWKIPQQYPSWQMPGTTAPVAGLAFDHSGRFLASAAGKQIILWEPQTDKIITCKGHDDLLTCVASHPRAAILASAAKDGSVKLWDTASGRELASLTGHRGKVNALAFHPGGQTLAGVTYEGTVALWDLRDHKDHVDASSERLPLYATVYGPQGRNLLTTGVEHDIVFHDPATAKELSRLRPGGSTFFALAVNSAGTLLACGGTQYTGDSTRAILQLWDLPARKQLRELRGHTKRVLSVAFSSDGRRLASAAEDGTVRLWDVASGQELLTLSVKQGEFTSVAFSPDGKYLAAGQRVWDSKEKRYTKGGVTVWWAPR